MVNPTPPEPSSSRRVGRDEWIAIFVTLLTLGGIGVAALNEGTPGWMSGLPGVSSEETEDTSETTADGDEAASDDTSLFGRSPNDADEAAADDAADDAADIFTTLFGSGDRESDETTTDAEADDPTAVPSETATTATTNATDAAVSDGMTPPATPGDPSAEGTPDGATSGAVEEGDASADPTTPAAEDPPANGAAANGTAADGSDGANAGAADGATGEGETATGLPGDADLQIEPEVQQPSGDPIAFEDVPADYWAKPYIDAMSARGVISGVEETRFAPENPVTRAEYAKLVGEVFDGNDGAPSQITFGDLTPDFWAQSAIDEAVRLNFLKGYPGPEFRPDRSISRLEVLLSLSSGLGLEPPSDPDAVLAPYSDRATVPDWAKAPVAAAVEAGLLESYPNPQRLDLERDATRAGVTAMAYQALVRAGYAEPLP